MNTQNNIAERAAKRNWFPGLMNLQGVQSINEAWEKAYPYSIIETELSHKLDDSYMNVTGYKGLVRSDGAQIACVKNSYTVVQPREVYELNAPFVESGLVEIVAGGAINNRLSLVCKIKGSERAPKLGEDMAAFVNFYAGLDGSLGIGGSILGLQLRCLNGMCILQNKLNLKTKHTKNVRIRLDDIQAAIAQAVNAYDKSVEHYAFLMEKKVTRASQQAYIQAVFEIDADNEDTSTKSQNKLDRVINLLDTQRGLEYAPATRGTAWQAYSAVTEYLTHENGRTDESRMNSRLYGEAANLNRKALELAATM